MSDTTKKALLLKKLELLQKRRSELMALANSKPQTATIRAASRNTSKHSKKSAKNKTSITTSDLSETTSECFRIFRLIRKEDANPRWNGKPKSIKNVFAKRVDSAQYQTYYDIIKQPICFEEIESKLLQGSCPYQVARQFEQDMLLVFNNATTFTPDPNVYIHQFAVYLRDLFISEFEKNVDPMSSMAGPLIRPRGHVASTLAADLGQIPNDQIDNLQESLNKYRNATQWQKLADLLGIKGSEEIEIDFDTMSPETFYKLQTWCRDNPPLDSEAPESSNADQDSGSRMPALETATERDGISDPVSDSEESQLSHQSSTSALSAMQSSVGASAAPSSAYSPSSTGPDRAQGSEALRLSPSIGDREEDESDNDDNDEGSGEEAEVNSEPAWGGLGHDVVGAGVDDSSSGDTTWNDYQSKVAEAQRRQRELVDAENQLRRQQQAERERADQKAQDDAELRRKALQAEAALLAEQQRQEKRQREEQELLDLEERRAAARKANEEEGAPVEQDEDLQDFM